MLIPGMHQFQMRNLPEKKDNNANEINQENRARCKLIGSRFCIPQIANASVAEVKLFDFV